MGDKAREEAKVLARKRRTRASWVASAFIVFAFAAMVIVAVSLKPPCVDGSRAELSALGFALLALAGMLWGASSFVDVFESVQDVEESGKLQKVCIASMVVLGGSMLLALVFDKAGFWLVAFGSYIAVLAVGLVAIGLLWRKGVSGLRAERRSQVNLSLIAVLAFVGGTALQLVGLWDVHSSLHNCF